MIYTLSQTGFTERDAAYVKDLRYFGAEKPMSSPSQHYIMDCSDLAGGCEKPTKKNPESSKFALVDQVPVVHVSGTCGSLCNFCQNQTRGLVSSRIHNTTCLDCLFSAQTFLRSARTKFLTQNIGRFGSRLFPSNGSPHSLRTSLHMSRRAALKSALTMIYSQPQSCHKHITTADVSVKECSW